MNDPLPGRPPLRLHNTALLDSEETGCSAAVPQVKRKRGRPLGSKTRVALGHVTADEFAFLRAVAEGVNLRVASRQYLMWPNREPEWRGLEQFTRTLLQRVINGARTLPDSAMAGRMARLLDGLRIPTRVEAAKEHNDDQPEASERLEGTLPGDCAPFQQAPLQTLAPFALKTATLEEFSNQFTEDMYSERELIELYELQLVTHASSQETGKSAPPYDTSLVEYKRCSEMVDTESQAQEASTANKLQGLLFAIDWLSDHLSIVPQRRHLVVQWLRLNAAQEKSLTSAGLLTIGDLADWIAMRGPRWFADVPRYGVTRASALEAWLTKWHLQPRPSPLLADSQPSRHEGPSFSQVLQPDCLTEESWPVALRGSYGVFRSARPNTLEANDDLAAVHAWLNSIQAKSVATQWSYIRSIEHLVLWAAHEKGAPLSSLSAKDLSEHREFLADPPEYWIYQGTGQCRRDDPWWRPLRGPLKEKSIDVAFAAICSMFSLWRSSNYLSINPAENFAAGPSRGDGLNVGRSFLKQDLEVIQGTFSVIEDGPCKRRLLAILRLLESTGLRRSEIENARWGALVPCRVDGDIGEAWILKVVDSRGRVRKVPVNSAAMQALEAHRQDRLLLIESGPLKRYEDVAIADAPLIGVLDGRRVSATKRQLRTRSPRPAFQGSSVSRISDSSVQSISENGTLSAEGIYSELKKFFAACAETAEGHLQKSSFLKASTHWMRHTFAHHVLGATDANLPMAQQLLGHVSLDSTSTYLGGTKMYPVPVIESIKTSI